MLHLAPVAGGRSSVKWTVPSRGLINGLALLIIIAFCSGTAGGPLSWDFLSQVPTDSMTKGGIFPALSGLSLSFGAMLVAFPWEYSVSSISMNMLDPDRFCA